MTAQPEELEAVVSQEIVVLEGLHALLKREQTALSNLDYAEIQQMSDEKLAIEEKLQALALRREHSHGELSQLTQTTYHKTIEAIKRIWQTNSLRFRVSLEIIGSLRDVLTGVQRPSYGPHSTTGYSPTASPVLTNEVG